LAHVQGESLKANAAVFVRLLNSPAARGLRHSAALWRLFSLKGWGSTVMSKIGFHHLPRYYRQNGLVAPVNAAELMQLVCGGDAVGLCLEHALAAGLGRDWFALSYWLRTLAALEKAKSPSPPVEAFDPLLPPRDGSGNDKWGRQR
jgi:hypothetical protein